MLDNEGRIVLTGIMLFYVGATLGINGIWLIGQARAARMAAPTAQDAMDEPLGHASAVAAEGGKTTVLKRRPARPLERLPEEHITFIRPGEIAVINIFAGGVGVVTATLLVVMGATQNNLSDVANAAFIMLFGFTYLFIAANQLMNAGNHAFGWFCLFIAISAVPTGVYTLHDAHGNVALIWLGVNWFVWAGLWFCFFLLLAAERPIMRAVGWATVAVAVATCWAYGYATLQGVIAVLAEPQTKPLWTARRRPGRRRVDRGRLFLPDSPRHPRPLLETGQRTSRAGRKACPLRARSDGERRRTHGSLSRKAQGRSRWAGGLTSTTIRKRLSRTALNLFHPGEPGFRCLAPNRGLIVGHPRQWPRAPSRSRCFAALCPALRRAVFIIVGHPRRMQPFLTHDHARPG